MGAKPKSRHDAAGHFISLRAGECLFKAGTFAESMFFVTEGTVSVVNESGNTREVALLQKGQIFGEKAYITKGGYPRKFSVYAKTDATVLEITRQNLPLVEKAILDLPARIIQTLLDRLARAERIIQVLQPMDEKKRIVYAILSFKGPNDELCDLMDSGSVRPMTSEQIQELTSLENKVVATALEDLVRKGILTKQENRFFLKDELALQQYASLR